jgi:hypothetical protein
MHLLRHIDLALVEPQLISVRQLQIFGNETLRRVNQCRGPTGVDLYHWDAPRVRHGEPRTT